MKNAKKGFSGQFKDQGLNYQSILDLWSKGQVKDIVHNVKDFYHKSKNDPKHALKHGFKEHTSKYMDIFYVQKAVTHNASKELPFSTLTLLGEKLSHPAYKDDIQKIIDDNVIKFKGEYLKLDDPSVQNKVKKALKTYQFEECSEIKKSA